MTDIDGLIADFVKVHHKTPYLELLPYIQYMRAAYALGIGSVNKTNSRPVIRSDGKKYKSVSDAGRQNKIGESSIRKAIKNGYKSAGYYWIYK
jgi:hypothetical protein